MATTQEIRADMVAKITEAMESGKLDWTRPWATPDMPYNAATGSKYHGMNVLNLWVKAAFLLRSNDPRWATFNQCRANGWTVRKGEKGTKVLWYTTKKIGGDDDESTGPQPDGSHVLTDKDKSYPIAKSFTVFNASQIDGMEPLGEYDEGAEDERCEAIINNCGVVVTYGDCEAVYNADKDAIRMPDRETFTSTGAFYATILHEIAHSTGHKTRLDRKQDGKFGQEDYAYEELVAEMTCAFVMAELRLNVHDDEMKSHIEQHAAYVQSWLKAIKNDGKILARAAADADRAASMVMGYANADTETDTYVKTEAA